MEVVIPLAMLAIGLIIGFFVARYMYTKEGAVKANQAAEQAIKELLAQQSQHHIFQVKQSIEAIEKQCNALKQGVSEYEELLEATDSDAVPTVPFFGEHTTAYLRNNLKGAEKSKPNANSDTQPRDFANQSSGLFVGNTEPSAAEKK
ncbi:ZapG family protein [Alteromonas lipolytica]|uniref:DUF1043 domain-containing protein n=1 Tax=Alteromonas lipolytica TaxID=1856405 RepID=A0A1E8FD09_9ALTE|nr:DUF1043 family protein [Alteromonas lipolytica]OFI33810.1 hypothetical protein BFC17_19770 [Alteromonas lipolytica]GGF68165.1 hypothetical protein GCM10011338_20490 [Alteromonas lipolytica]